MLPKKMYLGLLVLVLAFAACSPGPVEETEPPPPVQDEATVDSIEVLYLDTEPTDVQVVVRGNLTDGCTEIDGVEVVQNGSTFAVTIETTRPADMICTQALVPFEKVVPLDVDGLTAGEYTVEVNNASTTFELTDDNLPATPAPSDPATGSIRGLVWHDECGFALDVDGAPVDQTAGCQDDGNGALVANGDFESSEGGIEGVEVSLSEGVCPQFSTLKSITNENGEFSFSGLQAGAYCLFVDPLQNGNRTFLMPGNFTFPEHGIGWYDIDLDITESVDDLEIGWDFERLPPVNFADCINNGQFVRDITIPDDTVLAPAEPFTKTWQIRNTGTCHWVEGYSLVYAAGDRLSGETVALPVVLAGDEAIVSVTLIAPDVEGEFRGDWQLENSSGERFGKVGEFDLTFFLKITVEAADVATPAITGIVWEDECDPADGSGCVEDADGNLIADGELAEDELGIEEVWVNLYQGTCASRGDSIDSSVTDAEGRYLFDSLETGIYCIAIDELATENLPILGEGTWTHPALNVSTINVTMAADELREEIDFGWFFNQ